MNSSLYEQNIVTLYTDGACSGNPGPGGWGCILVAAQRKRRLSGYEAHTTNNKMELMAVISGLACLRTATNVHIVTDSRYIHDAFSKGWIEKWQRNNWLTATKEPVKNKELWTTLIELTRKHTVSLEWVKGHSGHEYNELCDLLARDAIKAKKGIDEYY